MNNNYLRTRQWVQNWLKDKPLEWGQVLAMRAALRALPALAFGSAEWKNRNVIPLLRVILLNWASCNYKSRIYFDAMRRSSLFEPDKRKTPRSTINCTTGIMHSSRVHNNKVRQLEDYAFSIVNSMAALDVNSDVYAHDYLWNEFDADRDYLLLGSNRDNRLASVRLWTESPSRSWVNKSEQFKNYLIRQHGLPSVWNEWFDRRIEGKRAAFEIPGDTKNTEDKAILTRLASAPDEGFWDKDPIFINSTIIEWINEAKERIASRIPEEPDRSSSLPAQNLSAISFQADIDGRIEINSAALPGKLRKDDGARDRHAEAVREAQEWLDRCHSSNAASRLTRLLVNYLEAAGDDLDSIKPSLFVQRGERLRQELARYEQPDSMLPPIADELLLDGKGWQSVHNMAVGLDPVLNAMDVAMLGPDQQPLLIPPDEIKVRAHEADKAELLADGVVEVVEEAADLAPDVPDPRDRHTVWSTEMVRNLVIEMFAVALNNPIKTGAVIVGSAAGGPITGASILGTIKAAEYLVSHKEWVLSRLGDTPTWQTLITKLVDWLEEVTPFKPKD